MLEKKWIKYILVICFIVSHLLNAFTVNMLEIFVHNEKGSFILTGIFNLLSLTGFLWVTVAILYNSRVAKLNSIYLVLPATLISLALTSYYFSVYPIKVWEIIFYVLNKLISLVLCILLIFTIDNYKYKLRYLAYFGLALVLFLPANSLDFLAKLTETNSFFNFKLFGLWHILFLALFILFALCLTKYLRNKSPQQQYLVILGLALILEFKLFARFSFVRLHNYQTSIGIIGALPLYICSFGAMLLPIAIGTRNKIFQGILFLVNMPGAIIVMVNPTTGPCNIFTYNSVYFFVSHIMLFGTTMMLPKYLEARPNLQVLKITGITLALYFIAMVFINALGIYIFRTNPNFSFVSNCPMPVPIDRIFRLRNKYFNFSPIYLFVLWLVQYTLAVITYFIYRMLNKKSSKV